jgi:hypothetical protein
MLPLLRGRARLVPPFRRRNPAGQEGKRFGGADGTLLAVVNVFAIEAEPGYSKLHGDEPP